MSEHNPANLTPEQVGAEWYSCAQWPEECCPAIGNYSDDIHESKEAAENVCWMLNRNGFGGDGKFFPVKTWVENRAELRKARELASLREEVARLAVLAESNHAGCRGVLRVIQQERDKLRAENAELRESLCVKSAMAAQDEEAFEALRLENARLSQAVETMRAALEKGRTLIMRHHDSSFRIEAGCFCPVCSPDGKDGPYNEVFDALAAAPETGWVSREEYDKLKENADFLRASVGEAHLMISRNDYTIQMNDRKWEDTTLPARMVNYVGKELTDLRAKLEAAEKERAEMHALAKDFQSQRNEWKARACTAEEWGKKFYQERDAARVELATLLALCESFHREATGEKP